MLHVVLVEPEIPPNTGNIGRLCLATGAHLHLIKPLGFSIDDRTLKRAGLDYWADVQVSLWESFAEFQAAQPAGTRMFFLTTKSPRAYHDGHFPHPLKRVCRPFRPRCRAVQTQACRLG